MLVIRPVGGEGFEPPKECLQLIYSQSPLATWVTAQTEPLRARRRVSGYNHTLHLPAGN